MAYGMMNLVMTATPIAMVACGFTVDDSAWVIQWHALAMYIPSFFTGSLIARFGVEKVLAAGMALLAMAGAFGLAGIDYANFAIGLILLGYRLELRLHRRHGAGHRVLPAQREEQGAGGQRLLRVRDRGYRVAHLRQAARRDRLECRERGCVPDGRACAWLPSAG
jgi:hypothetical protein